jgi:hypothetical protein
MKLYILIAILAVLIIPMATISLIKNLQTSQTTFKVTGKERVAENKSGKYLIFTDKTTFAVEDTWIHWRWDSSDFYGKIQIGKTYDAKVQGWRVPFMSWYQNLITVTEVSTEVPAEKVIEETKSN